MHFVLHFWGILFYIFGVFHLEKLWQIPVVLIYTRTAEYLFYTKVRLKSVELSQKVQLKSVESPQKVRLKSVIYTILYGNFKDQFAAEPLFCVECRVQSVKAGRIHRYTLTGFFHVFYMQNDFRQQKLHTCKKKSQNFSFLRFFHNPTSNNEVV